ALIMWQVVTFALVGWVIWRISGNKALAVVLALAFPAAFLNAAHGQNAFLSAGLFAAGLYLLPSRPVLAGVMFGVLTFKPQLGLLIPFALLAAWQWRAIVSAGVTTFLLAGASALILGSAVWPAFLAQGSAAMDVLRDGTVGWHKLISVYSGLRGFGLPYGVAMGAHVMIALGVAGTVIMAWRPQSGISHPMRCAMLMTGALIVTPFGLNYDLYLLAPAGAFFLAAVDWSEMDGIERNTVIAGFVLPVTVLLTMASGYSLAAWTVPIVFVALARRAFEPDTVPSRSIAPAE
ncbi:MAG: glycosyltransferase family 87 protein, partial [Pseudomonadota bacterium]